MCRRLYSLFIICKDRSREDDKRTKLTRTGWTPKLGSWSAIVVCCEFMNRDKWRETQSLIVFCLSSVPRMLAATRVPGWYQRSVYPYRARWEMMVSQSTSVQTRCWRWPRRRIEASSWIAKTSENAVCFWVVNANSSVLALQRAVYH